MQAVLTAAVESGYATVLSTPSTASRIEQWQELAAFDTLTLQPDGSVVDADAQQVRNLHRAHLHRPCVNRACS